MVGKGRVSSQEWWWEVVVGSMGWVRWGELGARKEKRRNVMREGGPLSVIYCGITKRKSTSMKEPTPFRAFFVYTAYAYT